MADDWAIKVEGLGKRYSIAAGRGGYTALRDVLSQGVRRAARRVAGRGDVAPAREPFWALRDVSFEVPRGECVGVIGRNGAGKSTLLKILSRITDPTEGEVLLRGRVGSLLEVGTGFHPELTGRENVFLNGAILGMTRREIARKFGEIAAFAEVEKFLDTPVKHYSSGMYTRLAFAVAAHLEPEILIVDEVLAVGDAEFQRKCLGRMGEVARHGRTVLFVSHNMSAVQSLCSNAIFLQAGRVTEVGEASAVVTEYLTRDSVGSMYLNPSNNPVGIAKASINFDEDDGGTTLLLAVEVRAEGPLQAALDLRLEDASGGPVGYGSCGAFSSDELLEFERGVNRFVLGFDLGLLAAGSYFISLDLSLPDVEYLERNERCLAFDFQAAARRVDGKRMLQQWGKGSWEIAARVIEGKTTYADPTSCPRRAVR